MKLLSLFLIVAGWFLVMAAIALLKPAFIAAFVVAGVFVEILGIVLFARSHLPAGLQEHRY